MTLDSRTQPAAAADSNVPWWRLLTGYHWFVFFVASGAWFFDCVDQRIFSLARIPALSTLMQLPPGDQAVQGFGKIVTAFFLIGWGVGGMTFGALGDRFGRARMLIITVLTYSVCTGLTFFSPTPWGFTIFRCLTGVGIGGVFGLAVALIAETVPAEARPQSLGLLQVLSTVGNASAVFVKMGVDKLEAANVLPAGNSWRYMFLIGIVPAILVVLAGRKLREPERWLHLKEQGLLSKGGIFSSYTRLFQSRRWRRNLVVGALIASTGVIGLWAIGEYAVDLQRAVFKSYYEQLPGHGDVKQLVNSAINRAYLLQMLGGAIGMWLFTRIAGATGRRLAFLLGFSAALVVTFFVYWKLNSPADAYWMMPLMGGAQLCVFAGFSIYLPELFPSELRSTGTSFCYNLGRFAAAGGSLYSSHLSGQVFGSYASPLPLRYSAMTMCAIFLIGLAALPFAPETRGKALPEDM
jgi:MFS family permease